MTTPVLRVGESCWWIVPADRMTVIVDADDYFIHLRTALLSARHSVLLIGWDFDTRIALDRDHADIAKPNKVGELLRYAVAHNPKLEIYFLRWDLAFLEMPFRSTTFRFLFDWLVRDRIHSASTAIIRWKRAITRIVSIRGGPRRRQISFMKSDR